MANDVLTEPLSAPLNGTTSAAVDIHAGDGNLTIDRLTGGEPVLASGTLQYTEDQGVPIQSLRSSGGRATLSLKGRAARRRWLHLPWAACNAATEWQIHLNPMVSSDITAHSDGGNVKLDLAGMVLTHVKADTGAGNMDVVLPYNAANLDVTARSGAGNVTVELGGGITGHNTLDARSGAGNVDVRVPGGVAVHVQASTGLGQVIVDSQFRKIDRNTYQSPDYDGADDKVEITVNSGAGNVSVNTR